MRKRYAAPLRHSITPAEREALAERRADSCEHGTPRGAACAPCYFSGWNPSAATVRAAGIRVRRGVYAGANARARATLKRCRAYSFAVAAEDAFFAMFGESANARGVVGPAEAR